MNIIEYAKFKKMFANGGGATVNGTAIPVGVPVDKIYFNNNLSIEETNAYLSQLTYVQTDLHQYPICAIYGRTADGVTGVFIIAVKFSEEFYELAVIYDIVNEYNTVIYSAASTGPANNGWCNVAEPGGSDSATYGCGNVEFTYNTDGIVLTDFNGLPIGAENEKIKNVLSITPFTASTSSGATAYTVSSVDELPSNAVDGSIAIVQKEQEDWVAKDWEGLDGIELFTSNIWTDGTNIYFSLPDTHKVLNNGVWEDKVWNFTNFSGSDIWEFDGKIYLQALDGDAYRDKVLNNGVWEDKIWKNTLNISANNTWICGDWAYCSSAGEHWRVHKDSDTWEQIAFTGVTYFEGAEIWTDGTNAYYSSGSDHFVYDGNGNWLPKNWEIEFYSSEVITRNGTILLHKNKYSNNGQIIGCELYELNGDVWVQKECVWSINPIGADIWEYNGKLYYNSWGASYVLENTLKETLYTRTNGSWVYKGEVV